MENQNGRVPGKSFLAISAMNELYFCKSPEQNRISVRLFILHLTMDRNNEVTNNSSSGRDVSKCTQQDRRGKKTADLV